MKRIIITEKQENIIKQNILKEAIGFGFSFGYLKSLKSFQEKLEYCRHYLGVHIGNGSSRVCFQLDDEKIIKLAYNRKGIAQNEQEFNFSQENIVDVTPRVFPELSDIDNYTYIVSEYVLPATDEDFEHICGCDFTTFTYVIRKVESWYDPRKPCKWFSDEDVEQLRNDSEDINEFATYVENYQPSTGDMMRLSSYGMVLRNGQPCIVLLDSGLTDEIYNKFYAKKKMYNESVSLSENIKVHKGEKGKTKSTQGKWQDDIDCPHCGESKAFFSMSISDGNKGRGRIKVTDENGQEQDSEVQTIALYYCPKCYKFTALNNMA